MPGGRGQGGLGSPRRPRDPLLPRALCVPARRRLCDPGRSRHSPARARVRGGPHRRLPGLRRAADSVDEDAPRSADALGPLHPDVRVAPLGGGGDERGRADRRRRAGACLFLRSESRRDRSQDDGPRLGVVTPGAGARSSPSCPGSTAGTPSGTRERVPASRPLPGPTRTLAPLAGGLGDSTLVTADPAQLRRGDRHLAPGGSDPDTREREEAPSAESPIQRGSHNSMGS